MTVPSINVSGDEKSLHVVVETMGNDILFQTLDSIIYSLKQQDYLTVIFKNKESLDKYYIDKFFKKLNDMCECCVNFVTNLSYDVNYDINDDINYDIKADYIIRVKDTLIFSLNGVNKIHQICKDNDTKYIFKVKYNDICKFDESIESTVVIPNSKDIKNCLKKTYVDYILIEYQDKQLDRKINSYLVKYTDIINHAYIFNKIYAQQIWNEKNAKIPLSGPGSTLESTKELRIFLDTVALSLDINTVIDLGCGDLTWMPLTKIFTDQFKYTGVDIVNKLIIDNKNKFPNKVFLCKNIIYDDIPEGDLIILKDILFHMRHIDIMTVLTRLCNINFKYILMTCSDNIINNESFDIYFLTS